MEGNEREEWCRDIGRERGIKVGKNEVGTRAVCFLKVGTSVQKSTWVFWV